MDILCGLRKIIFGPKVFKFYNSLFPFFHFLFSDPWVHALPFKQSKIILKVFLNVSFLLLLIILLYKSPCLYLNPPKIKNQKTKNLIWKSYIHDKEIHRIISTLHQKISSRRIFQQPLTRTMIKMEVASEGTNLMKKVHPDEHIVPSLG